MKKYIFMLLCIVCLQNQLKAQIGISATNSPPNASAMLDVSSITKGLLPPRMTSIQRSNIPTPANGLFVFDTDTQSYWFRQSGVWTELPKGGSTNNYWQLNGLGGNEITNTNSGGFWSKNAVGLEDGTDPNSIPQTAPVNGAGTRMMWIPSRSAFRVGTVSQYPGTTWDASNIGIFSFASGYTTKASGKSSTAMGMYSQAIGDYSTALGSYTSATGFNSMAIGYSTNAIGFAGLAMGYYARAEASNSIAIGNSTTASGESSTALGVNATATGKNSFAIGGASTTSRATAYTNNAMVMHFDYFNLNTGTSNTLFIGNGFMSTTNALEINGLAPKYGLTNYGYLNNTTPTGIYNSSADVQFSIYATNRVIAQEFDAFSDARHKKLRSYSNGKTDLALLNQLKVSNYTFIDTVGKGTKMQMGFIAQQVEEIVPEAINKIQDYIPSVYDMAKSMVYDGSLHTLTITTFKPHDFQAKDEIKLISLDKAHKVKVDKIMDANTFIVSNWEKSVDKIFVFGKRVDDFRTVDYDRLFTLGISSIQELSRKVEQLEKENGILKSESKAFKQMKSEIAELRAMIVK